MAKPYKTNVRLRYPTNPNAPREQWNVKTVSPGEIVDDIPARSIERLLERGHISEVAPDEHDLPADYPGRAALVAADITTTAQVSERYGKLQEVKGIGDATYKAIGERLAADAGEGGDE